MQSVYVLELGQPVGKGRPRFGKGFTYTPKKTRDYEARLKAAAIDAMWLKDLEPFSDFCEVKINAQFEVPKSWTKKKKELAAHHLIWPKRPDIDNIIKIALDSLNGVVYFDDAQVYRVTALQKYGDPLLAIEVNWKVKNPQSWRTEGLKVLL